MSKSICIRLPDDILSALESLSKQAGEKALSSTIRRVISDGLNARIDNARHTDLINRLERIERVVSVLQEVDIS